MAVVVAALTLMGLVWLCVRLLSIGLEEGPHPVHGRQAWQAWSILRVLDEARTWLFPLYSSWLTPMWLRALGARVGKDVEASTVLLIPKLTTVGDGAFLADDTLLGGYELGGGWLRIGRVKIGKHAFVGNSGMTAPGRKVPKQGLVAVLSAAPRRTKAKAGTSWLGSPPTMLRREAGAADDSRTYNPPTRLRVARSAVEVLRLVPVMLSFVIGLAVVVLLQLLADQQGWFLAGLASGILLIAAGVVAAAVTSIAKWVLVGRLRVSDHPLWSSFVWRNELADTFVEYVAAPWFARAATGTPALNLWLRSLGARIGKGVWCETVLAARGRPDRPAGGRYRQRGMRRADPPVPRSDAQHGHRDAARRCDPRTPQRHPPRGRPGQARYGRPRVPGDEGRVRAGQDPLDWQPDRPVGRRGAVRSSP